MSAPSSSPPAPDPAALTDGERWCRFELAALAQGGWRPRPWIDFIGEAFRRASLNRRRRRELNQQARRWGVAGTGAWLLAARWRRDGPFGAAGRGGLLWWTACMVMLDWHLGMVETESGEPTPLNGADALTLLRAWLVPAVAASPMPGLIILGGLTDIADGRVARGTRCTRFGRDLEGTVDACFTVAALRGALRTGSLSRTPVRVEQARLVAGFVYISGAYFGTGAAPDRTLVRSVRSAAPVRFAALIAAGSGQRRLADGLLMASTALATRALAASR